MRILKNINKKIVALITTGTIGLTSIVGCAAKSNIDNITSSMNTSESTITTTLEPTTTTTSETTKAVVNEDVATSDYQIHAKAVAKAMYDNNKEYFDEKQYTVEDLEKVYYLLNDKYYDEEMNLLFTQSDLEKALAITRELIMPQRVNELIQKYEDYQHGFITADQLNKEVEASKLYKYTISLANMFDVNEDNKDVRNFVTDYCKEMVKISKDLQAGASLDDEAFKKHMIEFFAKIRSAQTGNVTDYPNINNYLQETTVKPGSSFVVALMYKSMADYLNQAIDGQYVIVPTKYGNEVKNDKVRVGVSYEEGKLIKAVNEGKITETKYIMLVENINTELFQTHPLEAACNAEDASRANAGMPVVKNGKTNTLK